MAAPSELSVREIQEEDIPRLVKYWLDNDPSFLAGMGVDTSKLPSKEQFAGSLKEQISLPYDQKRAYCIIWLLNDQPVGHSNVNPVRYGDDAYMHLSIWDADKRLKGIGTRLLQMTIPYFFENLKLRKLYSEPYALNPAPNKTLAKAGFRLVKEYTTIPGFICFEQPVKRWEMTYDTYKQLF